MIFNKVLNNLPRLSRKETSYQRGHLSLNLVLRLKLNKLLAKKKIRNPSSTRVTDFKVNSVNFFDLW